MSSDDSIASLHPSVRLEVGTLIADRYRLEAEIGVGGMGSVWRAIDQVLGAPIALKVVIPSKDDDRNVERFLREARLSAAVQHPNVVRVTDFGTHGGLPFIAMEFLEGISLSDRMSRLPRLTIQESVHIVASVLRGLAAAHDADVVHRDIKPDNVFLMEAADGMFPKVLDFGISVGTWEGKRISAVTTEGRVFGTPDYMSPEQARGLQEIDHRTDLWSVAAMLFEMLTERTPFVEELPGDLLVAIVRDDPPTACELVPDVGEPLSAAIMRALEKDPEDRWAGAREFREALLGALPSAQAIPDVTGPIRLHKRRSRASMLPTQSASPAGPPPSGGVNDLGPSAPETTGSLELPRDRSRWVVGLAVLLVGVGVWVAMMSGSVDSAATLDEHEPDLAAANETASGAEEEAVERAPQPPADVLATVEEPTIEVPSGLSEGDAEGAGARRATKMGSGPRVAAGAAQVQAAPPSEETPNANATMAPSPAMARGAAVARMAGGTSAETPTAFRELDY